MAYPTSVIAFGTKSPGQTIASAHVNDLQTEVTALETGLLNGLQHGLTVSTGGFTVSTGNTVLGQNLTVGGAITANGQPRVNAYSTATQALPANTFTAITFELEEFDGGTFGLHNIASQTSRITATSSGAYLMGATLRLSTGGGGDAAQGRFIVNSTTEAASGALVIRSSIANVTLSMQSLFRLQANDYVEVEVNPTTSTGSLIAPSNRRSAHEFWAVKVA